MKFGKDFLKGAADSQEAFAQMAQDKSSAFSKFTKVLDAVADNEDDDDRFTDDEDDGLNINLGKLFGRK